MPESINLEITLQDADTILLGLYELPAKQSMDLINKIREQAAPQLTAPNTYPITDLVDNKCDGEA